MICSKGFCRNFDLKKHMRNVHVSGSSARMAKSGHPNQCDDDDEDDEEIEEDEDEEI